MRRTFPTINPEAIPSGLLFLSIFALALAVRLIIFYILDPSFLGDDEASYYWLSQQVLGGYYHEEFFLPLWPHLLALIFYFSNHVVVARIFTICLGSLTPAFLFLLGQTVYHRKIGLLAAMLMVFEPEQVLLSHMLYTETLLIFILVLSAFLFFYGCRHWDKRWMIPMAFLGLGVGLLLKHFVLLGFAGFLVSAYMTEITRLRKTIVLSSLLFFIPLIIYMVYRGIEGKDPWMIFNGPILGARFWHTFKSWPVSIRNDRLFAIRSYFQTLGNTPFHHHWGRIKHFFFLLWSMASCPGGRLSYKYNLINPWPWVYLLTFYGAFLIFAGTAGLCLSAPSGFRLYAITCLGILTAMIFVWYMASRYRLTFMYLLSIMAAYLVVERSTVRFYFKQFRRWLWLGGLLSLEIVLLSERLAEIARLSSQ